MERDGVSTFKAGDRVKLAGTNIIGKVAYADKFMVHVRWDNHLEGEGVYYFSPRGGNLRFSARDLRAMRDG